MLKRKGKKKSIPNEFNIALPFDPEFHSWIYIQITENRYSHKEKII